MPYRLEYNGIAPNINTLTDAQDIRRAIEGWHDGTTQIILEETWHINGSSYELKARVLDIPEDQLEDEIQAIDNGLASIPGNWPPFEDVGRIMTSSK